MYHGKSGSWCLVSKIFIILNGVSLILFLFFDSGKDWRQEEKETTLTDYRAPTFSVDMRLNKPRESCLEMTEQKNWTIFYDPGMEPAPPIFLDSFFFFLSTD